MTTDEYRQTRSEIGRLQYEGTYGMNKGRWDPNPIKPATVVSPFTDERLARMKVISDNYADKGPKSSTQWYLLKHDVTITFTPETAQELLHEVIRLRKILHLASEVLK